MASFGSSSSISLIFMCLLCYSEAFPSKFTHVEFTTISAAPAFLPEPPIASSSSPTLSPDISPLLPTPGAGIPQSPADSSIPIIPSSPSPPNPNLAPGPDFGISPAGSDLPVFAPVSIGSSRSFHVALFLVSVLLSILQLTGV